jgi:hypothetical protein
MNDLEILNAAWESPDAPSHAASTDARAALLARAEGRKRPAARSCWRLAPAAAAVAAAAVVLVVQNLGDAPRAVPVASAEVFERAAAAAEKRPFTAPRPDQWIYTEDAFGTSDSGAPLTRRQWHRAYGLGLAVADEHGKVRVIEPPRKHGNGRPAPFDSYEAASKLPTDPDALLRWAYRQAKNVTGAGLTEDGDVYAILSGILGTNVLPPEREASIFRALKRVPGVSVDTIEVMGRRVLSLAQTEDWLREELFLDPETYVYRGQRGTVVRDAVINPEKAGNATGEIKKGHTATSIRTATAIVDKPGETR